MKYNNENACKTLKRSRRRIKILDEHQKNLVGRVKFYQIKLCKTHHQQI